MTHCQYKKAQIMSPKKYKFGYYNKKVKNLSIILIDFATIC
jgi:hypothetical protein